MLRSIVAIKKPTTIHIVKAEMLASHESFLITIGITSIIPATMPRRIPMITGFMIIVFWQCYCMPHNVRRYVQLPTASRWHGFLPSYWMWRFFRFTKSSRSAKTMTPGGSAPAFSRGQPSGGHIFLLYCSRSSTGRRQLHIPTCYATLFLFIKGFILKIHFSFEKYFVRVDNDTFILSW